MDLKKWLKNNELDDLEAYLLKNLRYTVRLDANSPEKYEQTGNSRVGGYPDLPDHVEWPRTEDGTLMTLVAQLNLSEIVPFQNESILPEKGMLYFFVGFDEPAYAIEHKVLYVEQKENLKLRKPEESTALEEAYDTTFEPYTVSARTAVELPNYAYVDIDQFSSDEMEERYYDTRLDLLGDEKTTWGSMFGYPTGQHDDAELEAALMILLNKHYDYKKGMQQLIDHFAGDKDRVEQELRDMIMLLEIDSNDMIGYQWWDCGVIHFFIRKEDLQRGHFDRTYCSLYSS
ncbi:YwqG family protein [Brevibacillus migulae]|uniref:YwqG family protein n=1 Tax=Brevibacillus migulae TaxID=1644114 RepID=UPI00196AB6CD|nr:YwqG family protein [Brevibacillus migulae]